MSALGAELVIHLIAAAECIGDAQWQSDKWLHFWPKLQSPSLCYHFFPEAKPVLLNQALNKTLHI